MLEGAVVAVVSAGCRSSAAWVVALPPRWSTSAPPLVHFCPASLLCRGRWTPQPLSWPTSARSWACTPSPPSGAPHGPLTAHPRCRGWWMGGCHQSVIDCWLMTCVRDCSAAPGSCTGQKAQHSTCGGGWEAVSTDSAVCRIGAAKACTCNALRAAGCAHALQLVPQGQDPGRRHHGLQEGTPGRGSGEAGCCLSLACPAAGLRNMQWTGSGSYSIQGVLEMHS